MTSSDKNDVLRYYEAEMRYLQEAGAEFAHAFPDRAGQLGLATNGVRDPHVERLLEGFAFLMGRLRCKLDDELPELTEGLVGMLWPQYQQMVPSLSVLELAPATGVLQSRERIAAGLPVVLSADVIKTGKASESNNTGTTQCIFRTTSQVDLYPLDLTEAEATTREDGRSVLRIRLRIQPQAQRQMLKIERLRIFLHADRPLALTLYAALTAVPIGYQIRIPGKSSSSPGAPRPLSGLRIEAAGFGPNDRLWPKSNRAPGGYQLLLEYFSFAEKFMFVDLLGLDLRDVPVNAEYVDLEAILDHAYPDNMGLSAANLRLNCTPIINLFKLEADPIKLDHAETEYRVHTGLAAGDTEIYSVDTVQGFDAGSGNRFAYMPFASFAETKASEKEKNDLPQRYFQPHLRSGLAGRFDTWVEFGGHDWRHSSEIRHETISLSVTASNAMLPARSLSRGVRARLRGSAANVDSARVLLPPSSCHYPPTGDRFQWRVLSHLAPNYLSMLTADTLRGTLSLYDWTGSALNRRRIDAILEVNRRLVERLVHGSLRRGVEIEVSLDGANFTGNGDIMLFGAVLNRFFELYASLNLFTRLVFIVKPIGQRIEWPDTKFSGAPF
jgi:type VI secretion system protein ImpG